jgi:hypothetical protein
MLPSPTIMPGVFPPLSTQTNTQAPDQKLFDLSSDVQYDPDVFKTYGARPLINAVKVQVGNTSHNIFVGLPYLGCGPENDRNESDSFPQNEIENGLTLPYYRGCPGGAEKTGCGLRVWQSWHILFDNTRLALIKSPHSPLSMRAPLFGHQATMGPLHALALIIGNQLLHEVQPLEVLSTAVKKQISDLGAKLSAHASLNLSEITPEVKQIYQCAKKDSIVLIQEHLLNVETIITVVGEQSKILQALATITTSQQLPHLRPTFTNAVPLTHFDAQGEQLRYTRGIFEQLITGRERLLADMEKLQNELRGELRMVRDTMQTESTQKTSVQMKDLLARQGQTVSVFAVITAIFLPLGFFAQVGDGDLMTLLSLPMLIKRWSST